MCARRRQTPAFTYSDLTSYPSITRNPQRSIGLEPIGKPEKHGQTFEDFQRELDEKYAQYRETAADQDGDDLRYTVVLHEARKGLGLTMLEYTIVDLVHQLSGRANYPYCIKSKENMAKDLGYSRAGVFKAIKKCLGLGLLEKGPRGGLRTTGLWYQAVVVQRKRMQRKAGK